ncbi:MAG: peptidoglycan binding protein [uncultured bacterium]|nr:MAG: peptidoglycan binding protein [uncultured bacterium]
MNKKSLVQLAALLAGAAFISGCAPMVSGAMNLQVDEASLLDKSASYFGTTREKIKITSLEKGALSTSYQVKYSGNLYHCSIYYGSVKCDQPGIPIDQDVKAKADTQPTTSAVVSVAQATNNPAMTPAQAQARLNQLGYQVGAPDGVFGKKSVEKLKLFQKSRGLAMSGKLDLPTVEALR